MRHSTPPEKATKYSHCRKIATLLATSIALTIISQPVLADKYLDALAAEAESTANVTTGSQLDSAELKQFREMESLLEAEIPSTYKFYTKLYPKNKQRVFSFYSKDQSDGSDQLLHLQKKIMDLYFNQSS